MDSLFITAATGEPRLKAPRDSAEQALLAAGPATLDYLVASRLTGQTPRQRHYVERLFTVLSDSGRRSEPVQRLDAALRAAPDSVKVQLLRIGSALGDTAFLPVARRFLRADSPDVRKLAARSLGTYPKAADLPFLLDGLQDVGAAERQQRLWALSMHPSLGKWATLLPLLADESLHNRQLVRQIALKAAKGDWSRLARHRPSSPGPRLQLEWALMASQSRGNAAKSYLERVLPALDPAARQFLVPSNRTTGSGKSK
jgi:HEAT repeat protein